MCLKYIEKALEKYPPNCDKEEGNGNGSVPLFPTSVGFFYLKKIACILYLKTLETVYKFIMHCRNQYKQVIYMLEVK